MRVLCLAAHPDDETLGAGGTLLKHRAAGDEMALVVATVAFTPTWTDVTIRRKREECDRAARLLGISHLRYLALRTMHLNALPAIELNAKVEAAIREFDPHVLYAPPIDDLNQDHAALFNAANVAARHSGGGSLHTFYSYEIPTTTRFNVGSRWQPNTWVDVSEHIDAKLAAMEVYETELRDPPHPRSFPSIRAFARERGAAMGMQYAETHMLIRRLA